MNKKKTPLISIYFIDAKTMECKLMKIKDELKTYYDLIGTDSIEVVARYINGEVTEIICDEEGKLKEHQYISGISNDFRETLAGNLIIKSTDPAIPMLVAHYGTLPYSFRRS